MSEDAKTRLRSASALAGVATAACGLWMLNPAFALVAVGSVAVAAAVLSHIHDVRRKIILSAMEQQKEANGDGI